MSFITSLLLSLLSMAWFHRQEIDTLQSNIDYLRNKVEVNSIDKIKNTDDQLKYEPNFNNNNQGNFSRVGSNIFLKFF